LILLHNINTLNSISRVVTILRMEVTAMVLMTKKSRKPEQNGKTQIGRGTTMLEWEEGVILELVEAVILDLSFLVLLLFSFAYA
jgi:hypothetical protein